MPARRNIFTPDHPIVIAFLIFAVIAFLGLASEFLKPLALAVLLSFALAPLTGFLERRGLPRALAVVLTIVLALGVLGGITYKVGEQLTMLANDTRNLQKYSEHIKAKLTWLKPQEENSLMRLTQVGKDVAQTLEEPPELDGVQPVKIVSQPTFTQRLQAAVGPYLERLGVVSFVLILVLFMLNSRNDLSDRIIRLFGQRRVSVTTRTMDEVGQRISRYLGMFSLVNSGFGLIIGLGLWMIGVPYVVLWGVLFALLRFIPYVGTAAAFALPLLFSFAYFETWREPLLVVALFGTLEILANTFLEPVIYGRTTGVSALGLLVAAMFWTWLWGGVGLLLSTPLTVCLAALGKSVPGLDFFAVLLGEEDPLEPDVRFYHRLLAMDQDGATAILETALKQQPREDVFDQILIPALSRAEHDRARDEIDEREQAFIWRVVGELLDDLEETPAVDLKVLAKATADAAKSDEELADGCTPSTRLLGIAANDHADLLALRMLAVLLPPRECTLTILEAPDSPMKLAEQVAEIDPDLILVSHLPPEVATAARYLVRRLRARCADLPIMVGYWRTRGDLADVAERLKTVGATRVVFRVAEARDLILRRLPAGETGQAASPIASVTSGLSSSLIAERIRKPFPPGSRPNGPTPKGSATARNAVSPPRTRARPARSIERTARMRSTTWRPPQTASTSPATTGWVDRSARANSSSAARHSGRGRSSRRASSAKAKPVASRWANSLARSPPVSRLSVAASSSLNPTSPQASPSTIGPCAMSLARSEPTTNRDSGPIVAPAGSGTGRASSRRARSSSVAGSRSGKMRPRV